MDDDDDEKNNENSNTYIVAVSEYVWAIFNRLFGYAIHAEQRRSTGIAENIKKHRSIQI